MTKQLSIAVLTTAAAMYGGNVGAEQRDFDIRTREATAALAAFGEQAGQELLFDYDGVRGRTTNEVMGRYEPPEALSLLLSGSGLQTSVVAGGVLVVESAARSGRAPSKVRADASSVTRDSQLRLAQAESAKVPADAPAPAAAEAPTADPGAVVETILVSSSRIERDGFEAPTPVSMIGADEIASKGPTTIGEVLNQIPSFRATSTPNTSGVNSRHGGLVSADLRGLGANRTLVLVNHRRFVPSTADSTVDLRNIPTLLIDQVEVVTGGASAAWGSDAVAGVVNFNLKDRIEGAQFTVQTGMSEEGDNEELRASFATGGAFADDRLRAVVGADYMKNDGIGSQYERDWGRDEVGLVTNGAFATNGLPNFIISPQVHSSVMTPGGLVVSGPLRGTAFGEGGAPYTFQFGQVFGASMIGGDAPAPNPTLHSLLGTPIDSLTGLGHLRFELNEHIDLFAELSAGQARSGGASQEPRDPGNLVIRADNAYLPASVASQMATLGLPTITIGRVSYDIGKIELDSTTNVYRGVLGAEGRFDGGWSWDAYYQFGRSTYDLTFGPNNRKQQNWFRAVDAVRDPQSGAIVCRSTLTTPGDGCIPVNVFGHGSLVRNDYVFGSARFNLVTEEQVAAANLRGDVFSTWAGPISAAVGVEFRRESADAESDEVSQALQPNGSIGGWLLGNQLPMNGKYDVLEGYLETVVPLARDLPVLQELDLNAAVRRTDYSTSGGVTTWKIGVNYRPIDALRLRATRSRDIRAPSLDQLFTAGGSSNTFIFDPVRGQSVQIREILQGNLDLAPEIADSWTAGVVFAPPALDGFNVSVDWFDIVLDGVIGTLGAPRITNGCFAGDLALCDNIVFNPDGSVAFVVNQNVNLNRLRTAGIDIEGLYRFPLGAISSGLPGTITLRLLATYLDQYTVIDATGKQNRVGKMSNVLRVPGMPRWGGFADINWRGEDWMFGLQARYVHSGVFNIGYAEDVGRANTINENDIGSRIYVSAITQRDFMLRGAEVELYAVVNNLLDKDPPAAPSGAAGGTNESSTNSSFYDVIGRMYKLGVRVNF